MASRASPPTRLMAEAMHLAILLMVPPPCSAAGFISDLLFAAPCSSSLGRKACNIIETNRLGITAASRLERIVAKATTIVLRVGRMFFRTNFSTTLAF